MLDQVSNPVPLALQSDALLDPAVFQLTVTYTFPLKTKKILRPRQVHFLGGLTQTVETELIGLEKIVANKTEGHVLAF